jgi:hypothetical protein
VKIVLADENRAGVTEPCDHAGILFGKMSLPYARGGRRRRLANIDDVLD